MDTKVFMNLKQNIAETVESLSARKQQEVLDFAEFLQSREKSNGKKPRQSLLGALDDMGMDISDEEIDAERREIWRGYMNEEF
ncbi:MAG: DUF2281 domain-containing protein [Pyrinomonadaceae bacterium]